MNNCVYSIDLNEQRKRKTREGKEREEKERRMRREMGEDTIERNNETRVSV